MSPIDYVGTYAKDYVGFGDGKTSAFYREGTVLGMYEESSNSLKRG